MGKIRNLVNVAIDGPSGAGKSSISKIVAKRLNFFYLDTGAIYRNLAYHFLQNGLKKEEEFNFEKALKNLNLEIEDVNGKQKIKINNKFFGEYIRTDEISKAASFISRDFYVREFVLKIEREFAKKNNVIMDGRDIGTVVLPKASLKIFLTASLKVRALRRFEELLAGGFQGNFEDVFAEIKIRDSNDSKRKISPLAMAKDAVLIDTSNFSLEESIEKVSFLVEKIKMEEKIGFL